MKCCGTCIHYRTRDVYVYDVVCATEEYCASNINAICGYCMEACANYIPDVDYIEFMGFEKEIK